MFRQLALQVKSPTKSIIYCVASSLLISAATPSRSRSPVLCAATEETEKKKDEKSSTTSSSSSPGLSFDDWFAKLNSKEGKEKLANLKEVLNGELQSGSLKPVRELFEAGIPGQVGYGFLMGYSSGFCIKKVSKVVAFVLGSAFIFIQSLSYSGLIKVDYEGVQKTIENILDLNKDGKVDEKDVLYAKDKVVDILGYNMPSGGGFVAGLGMGLRG